MGAQTRIGWCDHTFNPWIGCTKVSPGCAHCYAEARDRRFAGGAHWGAGAPRQRTSGATWSLVRRWDRMARFLCNCEQPAGEFLCGRCGLWRRRPRVFCASLADVFDPEVPEAWRDDLFELIHACRHLDWLLLTKRPEVMHDYLLGTSGAGAANFEEGGCFEHVWLGVTAEDQERADERIPLLLEIPARVRFVSCEPLLGDLWIESYLRGILPDGPLDWVICGGESGPQARPMHPAWARSLRDQCNGALAGYAGAREVPFFFKQWGEWAPLGDASGLAPDHYYPGRAPGDRHEFADGALVYRGGKHASGLDGAVHECWPNGKDHA